MLTTPPTFWRRLPRSEPQRPIHPRKNRPNDFRPPDRGRIGYDAAAPEVKPALLAIAQLEHRAREIRRGDDMTSENT